MIAATVMAFAVAVSLTWLLRPVAVRLGLLAIPGEHRRHDTTIPLNGGLAIYFGIVAAIAYALPASQWPLPCLLLLGGGG